MTPANLDQLIQRPKTRGRPAKYYHPLLQREKQISAVISKVLPKPIADSIRPKVIVLHTYMAYRKRIRDNLLCAQFSPLRILTTMRCLRGCLHDTGVTFTPRRVHSGSLSWLYICLHDTTTKVMPARVCPGVSSLRLSHRGENFTPVRNSATVSCKHETTTRFGVK